MAELAPKSEETRARIIETAERHFRQFGYHRTTVADIAKSLGMSPGNVYRFFKSKAEINSNICARCLSALEDHAHGIADRKIPAADRVRAFLLEIHQATCDNYLNESQVHDMVTAAINEGWDAIAAHLQRMRAILRDIIEDGVTTGEFAVQDIDKAARSAHNAMGKFFHPGLR